MTVSLTFAEMSLKALRKRACCAACSVIHRRSMLCHTDRLASARAGLDRASLVVCAALRTVLVAYVDLKPGETVFEP